ncbi:MAG TPA: hypothetical protein VI248_00505 [Kineosporiaceae bacterium]
MGRRIRGRAATAVAVLAVAAVAAVVAVVVATHRGTPGGASPAPPGATSSVADGSARAGGTSAPGTATIAPGDRYRGAIGVAASRGLHVWLEVDLVKRWLAGRAAFDEGVRRVAGLARAPGVVGFKVADELGYQDGTTSADQILAFLHDTATALRAVAPGKRILVDMVVPELGCLPGVTPAPVWAQAAMAQERGRYPQLALDQVDRYVRSGTFDVLDVSTGLRAGSTYARWGTDRDAAQRAGWAEIRSRGWGTSVRVQSRKALAEAEGWTGSTAEAEADLRTWVDIPLQEGAAAVDVWTWAQHYRGRVFALVATGGGSNPLWDGLVRRRTDGRVLFTHFTPSTTRDDVQGDLARLATGFTDVFMATGTG